MSDLHDFILDFDHSSLDALPDISSFAQLDHKVRLDGVELPATIPELIARDTLPLPPAKDRENYGGDNHLTYWLGGLRDAFKYVQIARQHDLHLGPGARSLELGCSTGRVLRHLRCQGDFGELWGADINVRNVRWMQKFLPGDLRVFNNHWLPQLPLEDNSFDLVHSVSVFTHTDQFESGWLLELRRILKPGGLMLHSLHTDAMWNRMGDPELRDRIPLYNALIRRGREIQEAVVTPETFQSAMPEPRVVMTYKGRSLYNCNTFHSRRYLEREWGRFFKVEAIIPAGVGAQDLIVLRKTTGQKARRIAPPSLTELTPRQQAQNAKFPLGSHLSHPESGLMYCAIPKAGCTAGKRWFLTLAEPDIFEAGREVPVHKRCEDRWSLLSVQPESRERLIRDSLLFAFVREPLGRIASAFTEKFTMVPRERLFDPASELADRIESLRDDGKTGISFREFVDFACNASDDILDEHWRPQHAFLSLRKPDILAPMERLEEVLATLAKTVGKGSRTAPPSNRTRYTRSSEVSLASRSSSDLYARSLHPTAGQLLNEDLRARLSIRYARDVELYRDAVAGFDLVRVVESLARFRSAHARLAWKP